MEGDVAPVGDGEELLLEARMRQEGPVFCNCVLSTTGCQEQVKVAQAAE